MKDDVLISYEPFKQVVVMEYMRFKSADDLARFLNVAAGGKPTGIYWAKIEKGGKGDTTKSS